MEQVLRKAGQLFFSLTCCSPQYLHRILYLCCMLLLCSVVGYTFLLTPVAARILYMFLRLNLLRMLINIPVPANFWNVWLQTRQESQNKGVAAKSQTLLWRIVNRNSVRQTVAAAGWWSLEQDLVAGAGLASWYKTDSRWIDGRWCRTGICWYRKVVAGSGLVAAGAELVVAGAGRWSRKRKGGCWCWTGSCWHRTGSCWCRKVVASVGRWSLVQEGDRCCKKVAAGAELIATAAAG